MKAKKIISLLLTASILLTTIIFVPFAVHAGFSISASDWTAIEKDMVIMLNDEYYFDGKSIEVGKCPAEGYYGPENERYVYAGGANKIDIGRTPYHDDKVNGFELKNAANQMMGVKVKKNATVSLYYRAGGANRTIYMMNSQIKDGWNEDSVTVYASADQSTKTLTYTFQEDSTVYIAASGPFHLGAIEVIYPSTGKQILHLPFNDGSSPDISLSDSYSFEEGQSDKAIKLSGGYGTLNEFPFTNDFTMSMWVKPDQLSRNSAEQLFSFGVDNNNCIFMTPDDGKGLTRLTFSTNGNSEVLSFGSPFIEGMWTHVAISLRNGVACVYIDGVFKTSITVSAKPFLFKEGNANYIGRSQTNTALTYKGVIDEVRVYDYTMTHEQIIEVVKGDMNDMIKADDIFASTTAGIRPRLPMTANITYDNGMQAVAKVVWDNFDTFMIAGDYTVTGKVFILDNITSVTAHISVENEAIANGYSVGHNINYGNSVGVNFVSGEFEIFTENTEELTGYIAVYSEDGSLYSVNTKDVIPQANQLTTFTVDMNMKSQLAEEGCTVKLFLWKKESQEPITTGKSRNIKKTSNGMYGDTSSIDVKTGSLFDESRELGYDYITELELDRLLAPLFEVQGISTPNNVKRYGGWEVEVNNKTLAGESLGHWLSSASVMYRETGDDKLLEMINYAIGQIDYLQEESGSYYIGGCKEETFQKAFAADPEWVQGYWVPWYGVHKIYKGLIDSYYYADNKCALKILKKFADWAADGTARLTDAEMQTMLKPEHGGMNEVFAELYEITGDEFYEYTSKRFTQNSFLDPLIRGIDDLSAKHANTQIPKVIGAAKLYEAKSNQYPEYKNASQNFWRFVANDRSYAIGGNSIAERFETLGAESLGIKTSETCNTFNMLKLTELLYSWDHNSTYMDYYETALYNHILGSQDPETGSKMYFVSLLQGHHRIYEEKYECWWCCTGTGMENPSRYARTIYYEDNNDLYVNMYIPNTYTWKEKGLTMQMETNYPYSDEVKFYILEGNADANINFRAPAWLHGDMKALAKGKEYTSKGGKYLSINDAWQAGDEIIINMPMDITTYYSRSDNKIVYKYGPIVLANRLASLDGVSGVNKYTPKETVLDSVTVDVPYIITNSQTPESLVSVVDREKLIFKIDPKSSSDKKDIILEPFYNIHNNFHNVYWDVDTDSDPYEKELNNITIDRLEPDGQQDEMGHEINEKNSYQGNLTYDKMYNWREAYGSKEAYFAYTMKIDKSLENCLFVRYSGDDTDFSEGAVTYTRSFNIYVDDQLIATQSLNAEKPNDFYDMFYEIPAIYTEGKDEIVVKFTPINETTCAGKYLEMRTTKGKLE